MVDPDLERQYADTIELVDAWKAYLDHMHQANELESIPPQLEQSFLNAKARIAMLHDSFMEGLKHDKQIGANIIGIVNRSITLKNLMTWSEAERKKLEIEWHEAYLLLNETVTALGEKREELANVNEFLHKLNAIRQNTINAFTNFIRSATFRYVMIPVAILLVIIGVDLFGIYKYDNLRDVEWAQGPYSILMKLSRKAGIRAPYVKLETFMELAKERQAEWGGFENADDIPVDDIQNVAQQLGRQINFGNESAEEMLAEADDIHLIKYSKGEIDRGTFRQDFAYVFWFRNTYNADRFATTFGIYREQNPNYKLVQKANIIVLILHNTGQKDLFRDIGPNVFEPLPPV